MMRRNPIRWMIVCVFALLAACTPADAPLPTVAQLPPTNTAAPTEEAAEPTPTREDTTAGQPVSAPPTATVASTTGTGAGAGGIESTPMPSASAIVATVTGADERTLVAAGTALCDADHYIVTTQGEAVTVAFLLPRQATPGIYAVGIEGGDSGTVLVRYIDGAGNAYEETPSGLLVLDSAARTTGQPVRGSFDVGVSRGGQTVNISGEFSFELAAPAQGC